MLGLHGLERTVAIKFLRDASPAALTRLRREARLLAASDHPSVLSVLELIEEGGRVGMVTEYIAGSDLSDAVRAGLPARAAVEAIAQVAEALADLADSTGTVIVHRDLKPSNIRLTRLGGVKVLDFGVAWSDDSASTRGDSFVGSVPYMAPERLRTNTADPRGDVYALGCTLYEALSARSLHPAESSFAAIFERGSVTASDHDEDVKAAVQAHSHSIPAVTQAYLLEMLAFDPAARPTMRNIADTLDGMLPQIEGPTLKGWARTVAWPEPELGGGPLTGQSLLGRTNDTFQLDADANPAPATVTYVPDAPPSAAEPRRSGAPIAGLASLIVVMGGVGWYLLQGNAPVPAPVEVAPAPAPPSPAPTPEPPEPAAPTEPPAPITPDVSPARPAPAVPNRVTQDPLPTPITPVEPDVDPSPPPPGRVTVQGEVTRVRLRDPERTWPPGELPPGTYTLEVQFGVGGPWTPAGPIEVHSGESRRVSCNELSWKCEVR